MRKSTFTSNCPLLKMVKEYKNNMKAKLLKLIEHFILNIIIIKVISHGRLSSVIKYLIMQVAIREIILNS